MLNTKYYVSCDSIYVKFLEKAEAIETGCFLGTGIGAGRTEHRHGELWGEGCVLGLQACTASYIRYEFLV